MRGNNNVIAALNEALKAELTAVNQYILHAEMCENWGYKRLGAYIKKQAIEEMGHVEKLIERILFLDATPNLGDALSIKVSTTVKDQLERQLELELEAVKHYNSSIQVCTDANDGGSRDIFETLLADEENHVDFLEAQLHAIKEVGLDNYLAQQMHE